ncbi:MAG TPA: glycosyltransferase family 87 protein [Stellaceae bacterium]
MKTTALRFLNVLGAALDRNRVLTYCRILLAVETGVFLFLVAGTHGLIAPLAGPTSTDFVSFYAAGALADSGTPELAYNQAAHDAAEQRATAAGIEYRFFYYPPVFLLVCAALARLPYLAAFLVFETATLALCLIVMREILAERGWSAIIPVLAFPAAFWTLGLGQNSFLTAALFGAGTLWIDRRPILAGFCFGALCYKPHFALLVPVALLAGRHWRALGAALGSAAALCGLSLIAFRWETWYGFLAAAAGSHATYASGRINFGGLITPFGGVLLAGGTPNAAYMAQAAATLGAGLLVAFVWWRGLPLPIRGAMLAAATLVAIPVALIYDLMLAAVAAAWLVRDPAGLAGWERVALAALFVLSMTPPGLAEAWQAPAGPIVSLALLALIAARALGTNSFAEEIATT